METFGVADLPAGTGHGTVWSKGLEALEATGGARLVRRRPDILFASGHALPPRDGRPLAVLVHEIGWHDPELRSFLGEDFARDMQESTREAVAAATRVITLSESTRRQVIDVYPVPPERVHAVHLGVDHARFRPGLTGGRALVGRALGRDEPPYVLFVGVLHPRKNYAALREAVAALRRRGLPHALALVGNPALDRADPRVFTAEATAPLPQGAGAVAHFTSVSDADLARLMAGADAFCLPSFHEGFGLPALEAMACGAPTLVSSRGALPEVVADGAFVVEPEASAVEDGLFRILTDAELATRLRQAGRDRAARFSWEATAAGWLEVLRLAAAEA